MEAQCVFIYENDVHCVSVSLRDDMLCFPPLRLTCLALWLGAR